MHAPRAWYETCSGAIVRDAHRSNPRRVLMPSNRRSPQFTESALRSTGGYELVFSAMLLGLVGYGIDRWLGTTPVFVVTLSVLGFIGAAVSLYYRFRFEMQALAEEQA